MFVVIKGCLVMDTNYSRRLGGTDKFLTTTSKGKRIEVKSDILTTIYNTKIMSTEIMLPEEVNSLALQMSNEKQEEVRNILNQIFTGTSDWMKQVDAIEIKDVNDKMSIALADAARKNAKDARLNAEKIFDAKRSKVQEMKREYDTEDKLWLKAKQVMQIQFKAIEDKAKWKADFVKRFESEQKELTTQKRILEVEKYAEINRIEFENMSNESFDNFLIGLKTTYEDRIEAERKAEAERLENERLDKIAQDRRFEIAPYAQFNEGNHDLRSMSNEDYSNLLKSLKDAKNLYEAEQEKIRLENERLKKEAEAKELEAKKERQRIENERAAETKKQAEILANQKAILLKERQDRAKLEAELKAKRDAEIEAENKRIEAEKLAKLEAEKLAKAPDKEKLKIWIESMTIKPIGAEKMNKESIILANEVFSKFESFKRWAKKEVESL